MTHTTTRALANLPQLDVELLEGGNIRLEQNYGQGESGVIDLHPFQIRLIAESVGLLPAVNDDEQALKKRLGLIGKRLTLASMRLSAAYKWWDSLPDDTPSGMEGLSHLQALSDLLKICAEDSATEQAPQREASGASFDPTSEEAANRQPRKSANLYPAL
jgi:hypothetical protein